MSGDGKYRIRFSDKIGHIMNYGDGWYGGVYMGAMYALAYVNNDIYTIVTEALKTIPEQSKFHRCITDVIKYWKQYPDDWRKCWLEIENRHALRLAARKGYSMHLTLTPLSTRLTVLWDFYMATATFSKQWI